MAENILRLKVDSQEYDNKLKRAAEGLQRYTEGCRKAGGTLEFVEKETLEYVRALGQMGTSATTTRGKLAEMTKAFTEFSHEYNQLSAEEKKGEFGKALNASLGELRGRIQDSKKELDDINKSINGGGGLTDALDSLAGKFGLNISQLTKFGSVAGVATTALKVAKDAFFQSESNIDEWGRTLKGAEGAYDVFLQTLNNGNWSGFFDNLTKAINGGRDLYDIFDRLGSIKSNNAVAIATTQAEIQQLRLLKQQGQNVDDKIKAATARLAALQAQSANAGIDAGRGSVTNTLRNGVNSIGGAAINDATLNRVADNIAKQGQAYFDYMKRRAASLEQKGMVTRTQVINDSQGGTYERKYRVFDINALSKEQQKQYAIAKTVTERETEIQEGLTVWSHAINEQASSTREIFRDNRYALQGTGGGGKGGTNTEITYAADSIAAMEKKVQELTKLWKEAGAAVRDEYAAQLAEAKLRLDTLMGKNTGIAFDSDFAARQVGFTRGEGAAQTSGLGSISIAEQINEASQGLQGDKLKALQNLIKTGNDVQKSWAAASNAIGSIGSALSNIDDPAAKVMGTIAQAIANVALGYSQALTMVKEVGGPWGWIAFAATGMATMISTISAIHSATGYAQGGIVEGNTYSGDQIPAMLNAGETVLTAAMTNNLASSLQGNGMKNLNIRLAARGTSLIAVIDNTLKASGKGELATWK